MTFAENILTFTQKPAAPLSVMAAVILIVLVVKALTKQKNEG